MFPFVEYLLKSFQFTIVEKTTLSGPDTLLYLICPICVTWDVPLCPIARIAVQLCKNCDGRMRFCVIPTFIKKMMLIHELPLLPEIIRIIIMMI